MGKEIPDWLKKSAVIASEDSNKRVEKERELDLIKQKQDIILASKIEVETQKASIVSGRWRELNVDRALEDVSSFLNCNEMPLTNIVFVPGWIENRHHRIELPENEKGYILSVDYGYGFVNGSRSEDLKKTVEKLVLGNGVKPEDLKFLKVERELNRVSYTEPESGNFGSSFSHKLTRSVFSLELNTNGFIASQNFKDCVLRSEKFRKIDSVDQLKAAIDGFLSRVLSSPNHIYPAGAYGLDGPPSLYENPGPKDTGPN